MSVATEPIYCGKIIKIFTLKSSAFMFVKLCCAGLLSIAVFAFAQSELESNFLVKRTDSEAYAQPLPALTYKQQPTFCRDAATSIGAG